jgi:aminopeptidase N
VNKLYALFILIFFLVPLHAQDVDIRRDFRAFEKSRLERNSLYKLKTPTPNQNLFDVSFYQLDLAVYPDKRLLTGSVTVEGKSLTEGLDQIEIDLYDHLTVDSVLQSGIVRSFTHGKGLITIYFSSILSKDDKFSVEIYYHGNPQEFTYRSFGWNTHGDNIPIIWTLSEPYGSPAWWPCKDDPDDKADSVFLNINVPDDLIVASNGILTDVKTAGSRSTYQWQTHYPISTYLVSLAISNYTQFSRWYTYAETDSMEISFYVYPEHLEKAQEDLGITVDMMKFFASVFGEYPFLKEKYGMAIFPWSGGMEHQTITSYGAGLIHGTHYYDWLNAHELAHQWFGDKITMRHWSHIWLNEGFASYAEALWFEYLGGKESYQYFMNNLDSPPLEGSLFVTDSLNDAALFSRIVYDKGAWVLHLLRGVLGDSLFFDCLLQYATDSQLSYATAVTADFQKICEEISRIKLDWFFEEWVYRRDRPEYQAHWSVSGNGPYMTTLNISQVQESGLSYKMPIQIHLTSDILDTVFTVWDSLLVQQFQFLTIHKPGTLSIDPNNWILKKLTVSHLRDDLTGIPKRFDVTQNYPNPFNPQTHILISLPEKGKVTLEILNILGEKVYEESKEFPSGFTNTFIWRGQNNQGMPVSSGMYFYRVRSKSRSIVKKMILLR